MGQFFRNAWYKEVSEEDSLVKRQAGLGVVHTFFSSMKRFCCLKDSCDVLMILGGTGAAAWPSLCDHRMLFSATWSDHRFSRQPAIPLGACVVRTCLLRLHAKMVQEPSTCEGSPLGATFLAVFFAQVIVSRCRPFDDLEFPALYDHENK